MAHSKINICNTALAMVGAASIRSFDEDNKRARMCDNFYDFVRDYILTRFDWPFASKYKTLQAIDADAMGIEVPEGETGYQLPPDCLNPRDVHPRGSSTPWRIAGNVLYTPLDSVGLYYTVLEADTSLFSATFSHLLALGLAVRLSPPITQNKQLTSILYNQFQKEIRDCTESDANIGNDYRAFDENPENDSFVTGEPLGVNSLLGQFAEDSE